MRCVSHAKISEVRRCFRVYNQTHRSRAKKPWVMKTDRNSAFSDSSLLAGRVPVPKLAHRTLQRRINLAHPRPRQILYVSSAERPAACQIEQDLVQVRWLHGIRARAGGSGREDPLQQHKAVERRADHDDDDAGGALHRRLVRTSLASSRVLARARINTAEKRRVTPSKDAEFVRKWR